MYVNPTEVPGAKTGLSDLFRTKRYSIVVPESLVVAGEAYVQRRSDRAKKTQPKTEGNPPPYMNNPVAIAREYKMTEQEFLEEQEKALKEAETQKMKKDEEKLSHGVKVAAGESLSGDLIARQQEILDAIKKEDPGESVSATNVQVHQPISESNLDVSHRDMRRQCSWQQQQKPGHIYDEIPADRANRHRHIGVQGKSSSVAQGEGISDNFESESHQLRHGIGGVGGGGSALVNTQLAYKLQQNQEHHQYNVENQAQAHEHSHQGNQYQGGGVLPGQDMYGGTLGYNQQPVKSQHVYANIPGTAASEVPVYDQPTEGHPSAGRSNQSGTPHHPPVQPNFAASIVPPGSNVPLPAMDPNLGVGSRIQIPTPHPTEPFKYGVIRWIGTVPAIQGLVAGIEMVSTACVLCTCMYNMCESLNVCTATRVRTQCVECVRKLALGMPIIYY